MPNLKDRLELVYWVTANMAEHRAKLLQYIGAWAIGAGWPTEFGNVLEIGTGPTGGFLPLIKAERKVGYDPMHKIYCDLEMLIPVIGIEYRSDYFDNLIRDTLGKPDVAEFDTIFCADALDHGDMSFSLLPHICALLKPRGRFYLHVHLRPPDHINLIHDHGLTIGQLEAGLFNVPVKEIYRKLYEKDIDEKFCEAVIGVWEKL